jgi:hypothetical protein
MKDFVCAKWLLVHKHEQLQGLFDHQIELRGFVNLLEELLFQHLHSLQNHMVR